MSVLRPVAHTGHAGHRHRGTILHSTFSYYIIILFTFLWIPHLACAHITHPQELVTKHSRLSASKRPSNINEPPRGGAVKRDGGIATAPTSQSFQLPRPLDSNIGTNFTDPVCEQFITKMLKDEAFEACHPVSLLLETSMSFFEITKSAPQLTQSLDASCSVDLSTCTATMAQYGNTILGSCMADYQLLNPVVTQAYAGLIAYEPVYRATCMKADNGEYCYASAVTNATSPTSSYVYYLPLGMNLTSGAMPTCNTCLAQTMNMFSTYASNRSQPLSITYDSAAQQINIMCGPSFAPANIKLSLASSLKFGHDTMLTLVLATLASLFIIIMS